MKQIKRILISVFFAGMMLLTSFCASAHGTETHHFEHTPHAHLEDDFHDYVNWSFHEEKKCNGIHSFNYFNYLTEIAYHQSLQVIAHCITHPEPYKKGSPEQQIGDLFCCIKDQDTRNAVGWSPLQDIITILRSAKTIDEYLEAVPLYVNLHEGALLSFFPYEDVSDTTKMLVNVPASDFFFSKSMYVDEDMKDNLDAFKAYIITVFQTAGYSEEEACISAENIMRIAETGARLDLDIEEKNNVKNSYNLCTLEQLQEIYSNIDVISLLQELGYDEKDHYNVESVENARYVNSLLTQEHLREISDYTLFVILL